MVKIIKNSDMWALRYVPKLNTVCDIAGNFSNSSGENMVENLGIMRKKIKKATTTLIPMRKRG